MVAHDANPNRMPYPPLSPHLMGATPPAKLQLDRSRFDTVEQAVRTSIRVHLASAIPKSPTLGQRQSSLGFQAFQATRQWGLSYSARSNLDFAVI